jgi:excisionase family DNA binding protein
MYEMELDLNSRSLNAIPQGTTEDSGRDRSVWTFSEYIHVSPHLTDRSGWNASPKNRDRSQRDDKRFGRRGKPQLQRGEKLMPGLHQNQSETPEKSEAIVSNGGIGRRLLNVGEAARYLGLSVDALHKWVQLRAIPHVKAGRALRFDLVALNRYIDEHTIGTID